jgi:hypothetical protein
MAVSHERYFGSANSSTVLAFYARLWCSTQNLILSFTRSLPGPRAGFVHGEDLLSGVDERYLDLLNWLGLDRSFETIEAMRHPERCPFAWGGLSGICGDNDPGFLDNPLLRPPRHAKLCEDRVRPHLPASLWEEMQELAAALGYS